MEFSRGGVTRQLTLSLAERLALVHRQYRGAPCPPSLLPYSVLSFATSITGSSGACCRWADHAPRKPSLRALGPLGREDAAAHLLSRDAYRSVRSRLKIVQFKRAAEVSTCPRISRGREHFKRGAFAA